MKLRRKIRKWLYVQKSARLAAKGMKLVRELKDWGCESIPCESCYPYQRYHNCYIHDEIEKWNKKMLRLEQKYNDVSDELAVKPAIKTKKKGTGVSGNV